MMKSALVAAAIIVGAYALSWAITIGFIYLICLCFSWTFNLLVATGIWLIMLLFNLTFSRKK